MAGALCDFKRRARRIRDSGRARRAAGVPLASRYWQREPGSEYQAIGSGPIVTVVVMPSDRLAR
jgi:hypothetical protein